jgi:hypothetical protein
MHLYYNQHPVIQCSVCNRWWKLGHMNCAVLHRGNGCCHYGDTEVPPPEEK